ncbi:MAG: hypothetical protein ABW069_00860 [Duganella sp.]
MKISSLFVTAVLALGLAGSAAAEVVSAASAPIAAAEVEAEHCEPGATTSCDSTDTAVTSTAARSAAQVDEAPLPVPELETSLMLMLGLVVLGVASRRRISERFDRFDR